MQAHDDNSGGLRVVSLLASGTEFVAALGLEDNLVGISHECDYPEHLLSRPRVSRPAISVEGRTSREIDEDLRRVMRETGSAYSIDTDLLASLHPDVLIAQKVCDVCAVPTSTVTDACRAVGSSADIISLDCHTLEDVLDTLRVLGTGLGVPERAQRIRTQWDRRIEAVRQRVAGCQTRSVMAIEWLDPPFVPGHWFPEMTGIAGGELVLGNAGQPSREVSWTEIEEQDADVLLVMPCGFDLARTLEECTRFAERLRSIAPRAWQSNRAYAVDGSAYFNRSGPRTVRGIELLAELLHPELGGGVELEGRAVRLEFGGE